MIGVPSEIARRKAWRDECSIRPRWRQLVIIPKPELWRLFDPINRSSHHRNQISVSLKLIGALAEAATGQSHLDGNRAAAI